MIWNALQAETVEYASTGVNVSAGDVTINVGASAATETGDTLAEEAFGDPVVPNNATDAFGRPTTVYTLGEDGDELATATKTAVLTYTNKAVTGGTIYTALGKPTLADEDSITYACNGAENTTIPTVEEVAFDIASGNTVPVGGVGSVVEVYKITTGQYKIVVIDTKVSTIDTYTAAVTDTDGDVTAKANVSLADVDGVTFETTAFTADDEGAFVYYTETVTAGGAHTIQSVTAATSVTGTLTSFKGNSYVISGTTYAINENSALTLSSDEAGVEAVYYLDGFGNLIASDDIETTTAYAVVTQFAIVNENTTGAIGASASKYLQAELVFFDGTSKIVTVAGVKVSGTTYTSTKVVADDAEEGQTTKAGVETAIKEKVVSYTADDDGNYTLTALTQDVTGGSKTLAAKPTFVTGATANNKTQFIVRTGTDDDDDPYTYKAYTGFTSLPTSAFVDGSVTVSGIETSDVATYVFLTGTDKTTGSGDSTVYYVLGAGSYNYVSATNEYYEYDVIANGETTTLKSTLSDLAKGDVITVTTTDKNGYATAKEDVETTTIGLAASNGIITIGTDVKSYDDSTVAYAIKGTKVSTVKIETMTTSYTGVYVTYVKDASGDDTDMIATITAIAP
jgi:hypothetical protein